jgi:hypothetical protein
LKAGTERASLANGKFKTVLRTEMYNLSMEIFRLLRFPNAAASIQLLLKVISKTEAISCFVSIQYSTMAK